MTAPPSLNSPILVVGAGTFGLSTAWHLARRGYKNITVIDRHDAPSVASAGYDLNKVFRTEYSDPLYSKLAVEARKVWLEEKALEGCYKENGYIFSVCGKSATSVANWEQAVANSRALGVQFEDLLTPEDFRAKAPFLKGPLTGWKGVYNKNAGWTHARNALTALTIECKKAGVKFFSGGAGTMKEFVYGAKGAVVGVKTTDGTVHKADLTVLAAGAWIDELLDTKGQLLAKCWCFAHIQLTEEEAKAFAKAPVVNNRELGYFFEPDVEGRRIKLSPHTPGYTHYVAPNRSVPRSKPEHPTDTIPDLAVDLMRQLLRESLAPEIANRPFVYEQMCWDAPSPDANFIISKLDEHPGLIVAGGASAHGFKFLPTIGGYITDLAEGKLDPELVETWKWRPGQTPVVDTALPVGPSPDIKTLSGWKHDAKL
ncbi:hypothetical protein MNV49_005091 [Pseudohyphozyma bogoriensis]|nr:hypothetical protein MNV49_005091 [Pseudohyphozyma bogoriensis]